MTDTTLPDPLVPAEVDLRDFQFMPLDVVRLRDSGLASDEPPEICWAALLLWCAAWHQLPAGSIPDNDQWQAKQAGYVAGGRIHPAWRKVRAGALRNFVKCSDGRLYHSTIASKAIEAWTAKLAQRARTAAATAAREAKRLERIGQRDVPPDEQRNDPPRPQRNVVQGTGTGTVKGQGQGQGDSGVTPSGLAADKPPRPAKKCPGSWTLTPKLRAWATAEHPGVDVTTETAKFRDHTFATARVDWDGTWRNWIRKAAENPRTGAAVGAMSPHGMQTMRNAQAAKARLFPDEEPAT